MKKNYISPALKVRKIKINHSFLAGSEVRFGTTSAEQDKSGDNGYSSSDGTGSNDAKMGSGFNWDNPGE